MPTWSWRRVERIGAVREADVHYASLKACFAAVKRDQAQFGAAAITVDLKRATVSDAAVLVELAVESRDVSITSTEPRRACGG
ncbi:hypothetical protein BH09PSE4_BH09PSE4_16320 [soil metagenome]